MTMNEVAREALRRLAEGNARFVSGLRSVDSLASARRLAELAERGQSPFAFLLGCSDSRGPAEQIFDCGLGDLFVCRLAGNVASPGAVASAEYAALVLKTPLLVVMGHSGCGAVEAALAGPGEARPRHLHRLVAGIRDAADAGRRDRPGASREAVLREASWRNTLRQRELLLQRSPELRSLHKDGAIGVAAAFFDLRTGAVSFPEAPELPASGAPAKTKTKTKTLARMP